MRSHALRRLATCTAALGGLLLATSPAHAALTSPQATAYVASATLGGSTLIAPTPVSTYPAGGTSTVLGLNVAPLATTALLTSTTAGDPSTGTSSASATVANVNVTLGNLATLALTGVNATCTADPNGAKGSGTIVNGVATLAGAPLLTLPLNAAPNTGVTIPGLASVILNEQSTDSNGVLSVNAVHITLLGNNGANIILGHAECGGAPPVQAVPMISPAVAGGTAMLATVGGVAYFRRRKNSAQAIAS